MNETMDKLGVDLHSLRVQMLTKVEAALETEVRRICAGLKNRTVTIYHSNLSTDNIVMSIGGRGRVAYHEVDFYGECRSTLKNNEFEFEYSCWSQWRGNTKYHDNAMQQESTLFQKLYEMLLDYGDAMGVERYTELEVDVSLTERQAHVD